MRFVLYTNILSPHQLPLARRLVSTIGTNQFRYVYREEVEDRAQLGWPSTDAAGWITRDTAVCETAEMLLSGIRDVGLFERRAAKGLTTLYMSERWFKPGKGMLRLLSPGYLKMAGRIVQLIKHNPNFVYLPIGVHAAEDMVRLCGLFSGDLRSLFRVSKLCFERVPGGEVHLTTEYTKHTEPNMVHEIHEECADFSALPRDTATAKNTGVYRDGSNVRSGGMFFGGSEAEPNGGAGKMPTSHGFYGHCSFSQQEVRYGLNKIQLWGYFVEPSSWSDEKLKELRAKQREEVISGKRPLQILWVGRMLDWKRVDTLVKAVKLLNVKAVRATLTLVGYGPEEAKLHALAEDHNEIAFHQQVPIDQIRSLMREHDLYVLPSNGFEGWGAVVSEALEERMPVIGTENAGSSGTILPPTRTFECGDVSALVALIQKDTQTIPMTHSWTTAFAAKAILQLS